RGIAPKEVRTSDIYWGAVPWLGLQLLVAAIVIAWPELVTAWLEKGEKIDLDKVKIDIPVQDYAPPDPPEFPSPPR
ncbi:MAG TPA: C4-dicarboxylate ABC transporter, partial [Burkholderiales bacterium]